MCADPTQPASPPTPDDPRPLPDQTDAWHDDGTAWADRERARKWWRRATLIFEPRDIWIGVFVSPEKQDEESGDWVQRTYIAFVPMLVLVIQRWRTGEL